MQPTLGVVLALVFLPFAAAALAPLGYRALGERTAYAAAAVALVCLGLVSRLYLRGAHGTVAVEWIPSLGVSLAFYVDGLALLISFLASGVGVLILTYSGGYMHGEPGQAKYYATLLAFMGSMLGVALAGDLVALFVFWELTSLSSYLLIGHYTSESASVYASRKSMLITVAGGLFMLVGFLLVAWTAGETLGTTTYSVPILLEHAAEIRAALHGNGLFVPVLALVVVGAATKSAQVPFHIWLPNAMEAPTPVSAFLHSATMVKAGVYLIGRFRPFFLPEEAAVLGEWTLAVAVLGLATMTVAAILAVAATDIKELLAYSTASHLGLIIAGFGFANTYGAEAGAFHILNHASFKAALFLVAGIVAHEAGTREISKLGGLREHLPITAAVATVASLSMAGVPPFNGFYSKELLFEASYEAAAHAGGLAWLFPVVAVFGSVFTFLYSIKFASLFFGTVPDELGGVHRPPLSMLVPPVLLGVLVVAISAGPNAVISALVGDVYGSVVAGHGHGHAFSVSLPTKPTPYALMSAVTILVGSAAFPFYDRIHRGIRSGLCGPVRANWWYDGAVDGIESVGAVATSRVQTGLLRTYAGWAFTGVAALALGGYLAAGVSLPAFSGFAVTPAMFLVLLVAIVGAVAVDIAPSHVAGVLTLSILGFMVAIFYILADAPDLALTQLVVETLVLVIFLLVLDRLPAFYGEATLSRSLRDGALAAVVGVTVATTVLVTTAATPADPIAEFLTENAGVPAEHGSFFVDAGGGGNVVNVILVDFRAFDTMGEISVVAMAALAILTLVRMRDRGETQ
ncbi:MAG: hydrogen gas-evolving membrane-bound hydrogenase subunit E [Haloquadratum sp.]